MSLTSFEDEKRAFRTLRLLLSDRCQLSCNYCCEEGHKSNYNHLNADNIRYLISTVNQLFSIERIKLTGGEPLNYTGILEILKAIDKSKKNEQKISVVTNGVNFDIIKELIKLNIELTISLPSFSKDIYRIITNQEKYYDSIQKSLNYLDKSNYPYKINCVLVDGITNTYENISNLISNLNKHGVSLRFLELSINDINRDRIQELSYTTTFECFKDSMSQLNFKAYNEDKRDYVIFGNNGIRVKYIKFFCNDKCTVCPDDKESLWISCDGYVSSCPFNGNKSAQIEKFNSNCIYSSLLSNIYRF